jgi:TPR repeat protein
VPISAPPSPTPTTAASHPNSTRAIPDRQAQLFKRGADFLKDGNVAAARLMLQSVADAGNAEAALLLGATYDPIMLADLGVRGLQPDRVAALAWYRRAQAYGASEASSRIERLTEADR